MSTHAVVPDALSVEVERYAPPNSAGETQDIPPLWTLVSVGLERLGQPEVVLLLECADAEEAVPEEALGFFKLLYYVFLEGHWLEPGDVMNLRGPVLGHTALVLLSPRLPEGVTVADGMLQMVLLKGDESDMLESFGVSRYLSRWSRAYKRYPCVVWSSRTREALDVKEVLEQSFISMLPRLRLAGASLTFAERCLELRLPLSAQVLFSRGIEDQTALTLLTDLAEGPPSCLFWEVGEVGVHATLEGAQEPFTGCFVALIANQNLDGVRFHEDGFVLMCRTATWKRLATALANGESASVEGEEHLMPIEITWFEDGPAPQAVELEQHEEHTVHWLGGLLFSADVSPDNPALGAWLEALREVVEQHLKPHRNEHDGFALMLEMALTSTGDMRLRMATEPRYVPLDWLAELSPALQAVPRSEALGALRAQMTLDVEAVESTDAVDFDFGR